MLLVELEAAWLPLFASWRGKDQVYTAKKFPMWLHVLKPMEQDAWEASAGGGGSNDMSVTFGGRAWLPEARRRRREPDEDTKPDRAAVERSRLLDEVNVTPARWQTRTLAGRAEDLHAFLKWQVNAKLEDKLGDVGEQLRREV